MKVVFFGTPEYAVKPLQALIDSCHEVVAVVTQPDKAVGRSNKIVPTPVKKVAIENNIPVFQFEKIRKDDISSLLAIDADLYVTCAYGQILDENILFAKKYGVFNLHGSLLPKYRGASPVQSVLINNETETGVTVLKSGIGLDDGDIVYSRSISIQEDDNSISLFERLSNLSAECIIETLDLLEKGLITYTPQDEKLATKCSMFSSDLANVDINSSLKEVIGKIKGFAMWPTVKFTIDEVYFKIYNCKEYKCGLNLDDYENGEVVIANNKDGLVIKFRDGFLEITELLPINSKKMSAKSYLNGKEIKVGSIIN